MAEKCLTDYLGDKNLKSLNDEPFNEIDGVVLSKISNLHLEDAGINMGNGKSKTIADVFHNIKNKDSYLNMSEDDREFFKLVATNPRYKKMELSNFVCDPVKNDVHRDIFYSVGAGENKEQFAAVTIKYTQNGKTCNFVSYRATDSSLQG